ILTNWAWRRALNHRIPVRPRVFVSAVPILATNGSEHRKPKITSSIAPEEIGRYKFASFGPESLQGCVTSTKSHHSSSCFPQGRDPGFLVDIIPKWKFPIGRR